ncbi:hypothetical protein ACTQ3M_10300 [Oscillospiraceae bacterium LCP25S3_E10]|nr:hypothetical protein [Oscillospiraceae bacterium]
MKQKDYFSTQTNLFFRQQKEISKIIFPEIKARTQNYFPGNKKNNAKLSPLQHKQASRKSSLKSFPACLFSLLFIL